jgi:hypothetical protein
MNHRSSFDRLRMSGGRGHQIRLPMPPDLSGGSHVNARACQPRALREQRL